MDTVNTTIDSHAVTKFVEPENMDKMEGEFEKPPIPSSEFASIAEFLARPVLQDNIYWETTDTPGSDIIPLGAGLPSDGFLATNPMFVDKLKGYNLVSCTVNYRIQINSNPFQQGRLLAHFLPFSVEMGNDYKKMHNYNLTTKTQQPHMEIDCRSSGAVMSIPYLAPTTHYELHDGHCPIYERGRLFLSVLSQLKTGTTGTQDVEVAVWIYFTDVELRGPIVPQSDYKYSKNAKRKTFKKSYMQDEVDEMMKTKVISKGLMSGSKVAGALSSVPIIGDFAGPASWVMGVASSVAASLGFARPRVDLVPQPTTLVYDKYMACADGASPAVPLAMTSSNALTVSPYSYTDEDEMSFAYLNGVSALVGSFSVSTSDTHNTLLYSKKIGPADLQVVHSVTIGSNTQVVRTGAPISYLSNKFLYWRGTIKIRMSLVRTEMQSGRIQVTFTPLSATTTTSPSTTTSSYSIREIVDLATDDDLDLEIPYMMPVMYLETAQAMGTLEVRVLNTLRSPEAASPSIDVLVFASGGSDFEFAVPVNAGSINVQPLVPQSGGDEDLSTVVNDSTFSSEACVGEKIMSARQMLRFNTMLTDTMPPSTSTRTANFYPWVFGHVTQTTSQSAPLAGPNFALDSMSFIAGMYALYRGGLEVCYVNDSANSSQTPVALYFGTDDGVAPFGTTDIADIGSTQTVAGHMFNKISSGAGVNYVASSSINHMTHVQVPYYNRFPVSLLVPTKVVPTEESRPKTSILVRYVGSPRISLARRAAEDFSFSLFVGCPPWVVPVTSISG